MAKEIWSPEEDAELIRLKESGARGNNLMRRLKKVSSISRTRNSINTRYHFLRHKDSQGEPVLGVSDDEFSSKVATYDKQNVLEVLRKREDFIYGLMTGQADLIRLFDSYSRYEGLKFEDLMALDLSKRREVKRILEDHKGRPEVSSVEILYTRDRENGFSLVLPLYFVDVKSESVRGLASCVNDVVLGVMAGDMKLGVDTNTRGRFRELVRYSFSGNLPNLQETGNRIKDLVTREQKGVKRVYLLEDKIGLSRFS